MGTGASTYIPLEEAKRLGIPVSTTPGYANRAVAEHALALLFAATRQIARMDRDIRAGVWNPLGGVQLKGRRVAVVGLGGIGEEFANMADGLGMQVAGWNYHARELPYFTNDLDAALTGAEFVSLHLALNAQTHGIIDERRLRLLAPGAILVNTARSQLVDEAALISALRSGALGHAALDVFVTEPLPKDSAMARLDNVTLTSHAAYMTGEAYAELWRRTIEEAHKLLAEA